MSLGAEARPSVGGLQGELIPTTRAFRMARYLHPPISVFRLSQVHILSFSKDVSVVPS